MFLGADKFRHQEYAAIKKCSKCGDKNLRYLYQENAGGYAPVFLCGNGHRVYPYYQFGSDEAYVLLEGNPILYGPNFEVEQGSKGVSNCGCCDGGAAYGCNLPNQISIDINGILGAYGTRGGFVPIFYNGFYPGNDPASIEHLNSVFWGPTVNVKRSTCDPYPSESELNECFPDIFGPPPDPLVPLCQSPIDVPLCHECGTLRCSDENGTYRVPCSRPEDNLYIETGAYTIEQPDCFRRALGGFNSFGEVFLPPDINTGDISTQTIILDRVNYNTNIFWDENERRARPNVINQAYIETPIVGNSGSDVEPELIALIISESGTGGQIAFQTWPVTFDTDEVIEDGRPLPSDQCKVKTRVKAFGYGVMYPFIDDPIWRTESSDLQGDDISGGPAYNFPIFLPGKNYKAGDKIEFRFWQTLDDPPEPDPSAGEIHRTVVLATATITEVDGTGGILWYEFDGDPISGDCPCAKDKYCGWLSRACYPDEHPNTEDGIEGYCPRGETCEGLVIEACNLSLPVFTGSDCWPLSPSWDIGGYYGKSSCSGLAEAGTPATWDGEYSIPAKAPRYYYAWLPDPDCFFAYDNDFLEYMAFTQNGDFDFNGPFFNQDRDDFPGCSPLYKIYRNATTDNLDIKTRFKDYRVVGPPCRKSYIASDANTLFVKYEGGDGSIENQPITSRTNDNYCRVYGFYQQKQYDCGVTYQGQYILRANNRMTQSCEPVIGNVTITLERKEVKNDITISAPVHQHYLLPEFLPEPENGLASAQWPDSQGELNNWIKYDPLNFEVFYTADVDFCNDPRGNCLINSKVAAIENKIEYDCDNYWFPLDNTGLNWDSINYKEYIDTFNNRTAWRNTFADTCGYPWELICKKGGSNSDFIDPTPSCYIDENGEVVCEGIDETGNFTDPEPDPCNPYCMLSNSSANIAIKEIETNTGCPNGEFITADDRYFDRWCTNPYQINYTSIIEIPGLPRSPACSGYTAHIPGNNDFVTIFAFGDKSVVTPEVVDAKIQEYLAYWQQRYADLGLGWPGVAAIIGNNEGQPFDRGLTNFYNTMFEIEGLGRIHLLNQLCTMATYIPPTESQIDCPTKDDWLAVMYNEGINGVHEFAGKIKEIAILNPGDGYAFEVEDRYAPTGVVQPKDIILTIDSLPKNLRRKLETWSLNENYTIEHSGTGYSIGDTIPISFNDEDAIDGVQYKTVPTLEVTDVNDDGQILETQILNSGEYHKLIKTGHHRAYPISIILNNYWESPKDGIVGIGRHAKLRAVVGIDPTKDTYGKIVDIKIDEPGLEYLPTGKYWAIDTQFSDLGIDHLVDPCKYDLLAKDEHEEKYFINEQFQSNQPQGEQHILPPLSMNDGQIIKWRDKVLPWSTILTSGDCPNELLSRSYKMALSESVYLLQADCSEGTCEQIMGSIPAQDENGQPVPEDPFDGFYQCNRWTGFYAHAFKEDCFNAGRYDDIWAELFYGSPVLVYAKSDLGDIDAVCSNVPGCYRDPRPPHDGLNSPFGLLYGGNQNSSDHCVGGTEYSIVGVFTGAPQNTAEPEPYGSATHRIYKMGGSDITMVVSTGVI